MRWYLAAPFIFSESDRWLAPFVPQDGDELSFQVVPATYDHDRSRKITGLAQWSDYFRHGNTLWREANSGSKPCGMLTCFPQIPIAAGARKLMARSDMPLVAWTFNLGTLYTGAKQLAAKATLRAVDRFIVHSTHEVASYSEWLGLPKERFSFVPLQRATMPIVVPEDEADPFVLSMGSAQRDYRLLFEVLRELRYRAVVVAGPHAVAGLNVPSNVEVLSGLSTQQCHVLVQRARVNVIPIANLKTASGQVTLLEAMTLGRAVVVTESPASVDYVVHGHDGMLIRPGDHTDMRNAIQRLWEDASLRRLLGQNARATSVARFSDEAAGRQMGLILRDVAKRH